MYNNKDFIRIAAQQQEQQHQQPFFVIFFSFLFLGGKFEKQNCLRRILELDQRRPS
jgi:hypothetical protein